MQILSNIVAAWSRKGQVQEQSKEEDKTALSPSEAKSVLGISPEEWALLLKCRKFGSMEKALIYQLGLNEQDINIIKGISGDNIDRTYFSVKDAYRANRSKWRQEMFESTENLFAKVNLEFKKLFNLAKAENHKQNTSLMADTTQHIIYLFSVMLSRFKDVQLYDKMNKQVSE